MNKGAFKKWLARGFYCFFHFLFLGVEVLGFRSFLSPSELGFYIFWVFLSGTGFFYAFMVIRSPGHLAEEPGPKDMSSIKHQEASSDPNNEKGSLQIEMKGVGPSPKDIKDYYNSNSLSNSFDSKDYKFHDDQEEQIVFAELNPIKTQENAGQPVPFLKQANLKEAQPAAEKSQSEGQKEEAEESEIKMKRTFWQEATRKRKCQEQQLTTSELIIKYGSVESEAAMMGENMRKTMLETENHQMKSQEGDSTKGIETEQERRKDMLVAERHYCTECNREQFLRMRHCLECGTCQPCFDHHCPWIGSCIGEKNHGAFLVFLFFQSGLFLLFDKEVYSFFRGSNAYSLSRLLRFSNLKWRNGKESSPLRQSKRSGF